MPRRLHSFRSCEGETPMIRHGTWMVLFLVGCGASAGDGSGDVGGDQPSTGSAGTSAPTGSGGGSVQAGSGGGVQAGSGGVSVQGTGGHAGTAATGGAGGGAGS